MNKGNKGRYCDSDILKRLPLFFQPWWLDETCSEWDVALTEENGEIQSIFPYRVERKLNLRLIRKPELCPYLGPYFLFQEEKIGRQWTKEEQNLKSLLQQVNSWDYLLCSTCPGYDNFLSFYNLGLTHKARLTYRIDLQQYETDIFAKFQSRLRTYIRKAEKELTIDTRLPEELNLLVEWHKKAFSDKGAYYPFHEKQLRNVMAAAEAHQASLFQTAKDKDGKVVAMLWTPFDATVGYHLIAATRPGGVHNGALALLVWNAIRVLKEKGLKIYDFEGSMDPGIEGFFRKFGGERTIYFNYESTRSLLWKLKRLVTS